MPDIRELFGDLFAHVLLFERTLREGKSHPSYVQVHDQISKLLDKQEAAAKSEGIADDENQDARFAVVAWIDETILRQSAWQGRGQWEGSPLQLEYFKTWNAGVELFERLGKLRPEQKELREVYYLCLSLGFRGQYSNDEVKVIQILRDQAPHLLRPVEDLQTINKLTPQPYDIPTPNSKPAWSPWSRRLLNTGLWVLVGVPLVLFLVLHLVPQHVIPNPTPMPQTPQLPPISPQSDIKEVVKKILEPYTEQCANIFIESLDLQNRVVSLGGRAASASQQAEIRMAVQSVPGGLQVNDKFEIIPRPFCEVLKVLEPFKNAALKMSLNKSAQEGRPIYHTGENLVANVTTPPTLQSYLYVDYFTSDAKVTHLFPNVLEKMRSFPPNTSYTVGEPGNPERMEIRIKPPAGLELITVIASKSQLFSTQRPLTEMAEPYLKELHQVLPDGISKSDVASMFYFLTNQSQ